MSLEGRVALVTGAGGQGMGRSIALTLARDGADIVLNHHRKHEQAENTARAIEQMGRRVLPYAGDVANPSQVDAMVAAGIERFGHVDIVVNSAGGPWTPQDVTQIEPAHLREVLGEEIESVFYILRTVLPGMRERRWGRIVSIGGHMAEAWRFGPPEAPIDYPLGKAARHWLTRTLAPLERPYGITINAVAPGPTRRITLDEALAALRGEDVGGAGNHPQHIADVVAYFCSDGAERVTGAVVPVPGATAI
ncbi:MAG: SDR family oxidoreductase [Dehalococcoidia bacterium]